MYPPQYRTGGYSRCELPVIYFLVTAGLLPYVVTYVKVPLFFENHLG